DDHEIGQAGIERGERLLARRVAGDAIPLAPQRRGIVVANRDLVLDDRDELVRRRHLLLLRQDARRRRARPPAARRSAGAATSRSAASPRSAARRNSPATEIASVIR